MGVEEIAEAIRPAVESAFAALTAEEIEELVMESFRMEVRG